MSNNTHYEMLEIALRRGSSKRANRWIDARGTYHERMSFAGPSPSFDGRIDCYLGTTPIFTIDFNNELVRAYDTRHQKTGREIRHWSHALFNMFQLKNVWHYPFWTSDDIHNHAFGSRMPWHRRIGNRNWFHWPSFNYERAEEYFLSDADLQHNQHWRWFTYRWDGEGQWSRQFIDKDAERRWRARERKRENDLQRGLHGVSP